MPSIVTFDAIWDTGATHSVITQKVIDDCGLVATGVTQVHHVQGNATSETFLVNVVLPDKVMIGGVRVTKGNLTGADILVGMDIINRGDFAVTNHNGITKFSFRVPSQGHIDFVPEIAQARTPSQQQNRAQRREAKRKAKKN